MNQAHLIARRLAAEGKPVSRRALRTGGAKGSNQALNILARTVNAELAANPTRPGDATELAESDDLQCLSQDRRLRSLRRQATRRPPYG
jgi:hypothetical protein